MSNAKQTIGKGPFRYDVVGSFLRPESVKKARQEVEAGTLGKAELRKVEDEAIRDLVTKEIGVGLKAVTDGEFRRAYWHLDFLEALDGVERIKAEQWSVAFKGHQPKAATLKITGTIDFTDHPFLKDFAFLRDAVGNRAVPKITIPSPSMLHLICCVREENYEPIPQYKDQDALFKDIAKAYRKAIHAFYEAGCRYLQLDDTSWGEFCDEDKREAYAKRGFDLDRIAKEYVKVLNKVLAVKPKDMVITMHICRGNFRSTWFSSGGYGPIAKTLLRTVLSMDSFSNTIRIGQGTSIRSTISRTKRLFWALLPQNRQTLKIRKPSKDGSRKQAPWFPWISWPLARNAALLPRKKAISSRKKTSGRSSPLSAALPVKSGPMPIEFRLS